LTGRARRKKEKAHSTRLLLLHSLSLSLSLSLSWWHLKGIHFFLPTGFLLLLLQSAKLSINWASQRERIEKERERERERVRKRERGRAQKKGKRFYANAQTIFSTVLIRVEL